VELHESHSQLLSLFQRACTPTDCVDLCGKWVDDIGQGLTLCYDRFTIDSDISQHCAMI